MLSFVTWQCRSCGAAKNPGTSSVCKSCGGQRKRGGGSSSGSSPLKKKAKTEEDGKKTTDQVSETQNTTQGGGNSSSSTSGMSGWGSLARRQSKGLVAKFRSISLPGEWVGYSNGSVLLRKFGGNEATPMEKVAAFDFDECLCTFGFQSAYVGQIERYVTFPIIKDLFQRLSEDGYRLVIFSNDNLARFKNPDPIKRRIARKTKQLDDFVAYTDVPIEVYVSTLYDKFRKPSSKDKEKHGDSCGGIGMWELMATNPFDLERAKVKPNLAQSFYVGDAAGRQGDHSDGDLNFAKEIGIDFYTPEQFFLNDGKGLELMGLNHSTSSTSQTKELLNLPNVIKMLLEALNNNKEQTILVVMNGLPGSGKTSIASKLVELLGEKVCSRFSQDLLKTKAKVESAVAQALQNHRVVIVDRTNVSVNDREIWVHLAANAGAKVALVCLDTPVLECVQRCATRTNHEGEKFPTDRADIKKVINSISFYRETPNAEAEGIDMIISPSPSTLENMVAEVGNRLVELIDSKQEKIPKPQETAPTNHVFAFSSISTGDFRFPAKDAAEVLIRTASRFLEENRMSMSHVKLVLVEPPSSQVLDAIKNDPQRAKEVENLKHFSVVTGNLVEYAPAFAYGVGCGNHLGRPGENKNNLMLHKALGKPLFEALSKTNPLAEVGRVYHVQIPPGNKLGSKNGVKHVLMILGPNMNPDREQCLGSDQGKAKELLELCYLRLFKGFLKRISCNSTTTEGSSVAVQVNVDEYENPPSIPKSKFGWENCLKDYLQPILPSPLHEKQVFFKNDEFCVIYDAFPKAKVHLLILPIRGELGKVDKMVDLQPGHLEGLRRMQDLGNKIIECVKKLNVTKDEIRMGFHAIPTLTHLHLHVISQDFDSARMKNKKHWVSFTSPDYFIPLQQVITMLTEGQPLDVFTDKANAALNTKTLKCHRCAQDFPNIPKLKQHIASCTKREKI